MLAPDVRFEGFTSRDWERVLELFRPARPKGKPRDPDRPQGGIIAVHAGGKLHKLLHTRVGRLRLDELAPDWPVPVAELASRHHASWALSVEAGALEAVMDGFGERLRPEDDLTAQILLLGGLFREQAERGRIDLWPDRLRTARGNRLPLPTATMVGKSLDMICQVGRTMLLGLFDGGELWTCVALSRGERGFDLVLGPEELRRELGLLSGDMRRDHRHLARLVARRTSPLSFGCFADYRTFRALEVDPTPGAWAVAVAVRDVVLDPVPAAMALPLALDAGRAAWGAIRGIASRLDATGMLAPTLAALRDRALGDRKLGDLLGFDPLELLRKLLSREQ
ncbi:MAG: hypothetical protein IT373_28050 [Polyangiaceae bacterium]|nr:hypothetical protein [Polyangiaceae bacterium]